jgi:adenylate cyclase
MALFGVDDDVAAGSRAALAAARLMAEKLEELNRGLAHDLHVELRIGIGIHSGPAIVGEMGYAQATSLTAVGDTVNTASRLEAMTKEFGAQLVVSEPLVRHAGVELDPDRFPRREIEVRGRSNHLAVRVVEDAKFLPG